MRDEKGLNRGFGFVCFTTLEEANKAMVEWYGNNFICRDESLEYLIVHVLLK